MSGRPEMTGFEPALLRRAATLRPGALASRDDFGCAVRYAELEAMVADLARTLAAEGVRERSVVSLLLPNSVLFSATFLAVRSLGAVVNPIAPFYGPGDLAGMLRRTDPTAIVAIDEYRGRTLAADLADTELDAAILAARPGAVPELTRLRPVAPRRRRPLPDPIALVVFTSGSEGAPKGVIHSSRSFGHASRGTCAMSQLTADDVFVSAAPLGHLTGMFGGFRNPLEVGGTAILLDRWDPEHALDTIERHQVTYMHGPPTMLVDMTAIQRAAPRSLDTLRMFRSAGAALTAPIVREAEEVLELAVVRGYGCSETLIITNSLLTDDAMQRAETDGAILDGVELDLRTDALGDELCVRGATRFMGYLPVEPDADVESALLDAADWFPTGDLVERVGERHLRVVGRKKDIIVRGGLNISSSEVEGFLERHPRIEAVVVVPVPDDRLGERCCAVIVPRDERPTLASIKEFLLGQGVAMFKVPEQLVFMSELPKTANGKVARREVRRLIADEKASGL